MINILIHILLSPLYVILFTARHELSHAAVYKMIGYDILEFKIIPFKTEEGKWLFGRVRFSGPRTFHGALAPYYVDVVFLIIGILLLWGPVTAGANHLFLITLVVFFIAPVVDFIRALWKWKNGWGDLYEAWELRNNR